MTEVKKTGFANQLDRAYQSGENHRRVEEEKQRTAENAENEKSRRSWLSRFDQELAECKKQLLKDSREGRRKFVFTIVNRCNYIPAGAWALAEKLAEALRKEGLTVQVESGKEQKTGEFVTPYTVYSLWLEITTGG